MVLLDGKYTSAAIKEGIAAKVREMKEAGKPVPHLVAVLVGNDGASMTYVANKEAACAQVGFKSTVLRFPDTISEEQLLAEVDKLNKDASVDGFIVQLPLPKHISEKKVIAAISPDKDVDGFHIINVGKLTQSLPTFVSATPKGILSLLDQYNVETAGKHCVVIGRSNIVGRPISILLNQKGYDCTVTVCHSRSKNIEVFTRMADIIIAAVGIPEFVTGDMVKEGAIVVDVGITRVPDDTKPKGYRIVGDVKFDEVAPKCSYITPVPGGVGPMTIVSLLQNTLQAAEARM
ncbi:MAG: bifunctional 5,10-methylene-tetrahydrofolate dehydrogenase/5,10-methylene-tetrahydrofolate cyclohydrolase [Bacteroidales bacterium]|nr:bifunctional 5,10-methylene-tetrahydrofolate dehydrogenase/5,10-methylene-tetrahydrofolate cyclohydrolase [Bacteroidales bacterium]